MGFKQRNRHFLTKINIHWWELRAGKLYRFRVEIITCLQLKFWSKVFAHKTTERPLIMISISGHIITVHKGKQE